MNERDDPRDITEDIWPDPPEWDEENRMKTKVTIEAEISDHEPAVMLPVRLPISMKEGEHLNVVLTSRELVRVLRQAGYVVVKGELV